MSIVDKHSNCLTVSCHGKGWIGISGEPDVSDLAHQVWVRTAQLSPTVAETDNSNNRTIPKVDSINRIAVIIRISNLALILSSDKSCSLFWPYFIHYHV